MNSRDGKTKPPGRRDLLSGLAATAAGTAFALSAPRGAAAAEIEQPASPEPRFFMQRAQDMKNRALAAGDQGYGAVIVKDGRIVGQAPSRVVTNGDPTAHAEVEAIRDAARRLGIRDLSGCVMYGTSPACQMCETAGHWANLKALVHGASLTDAGRPKYRRC